jgi:3-dehydroquinate synthase
MSNYQISHGHAVAIGICLDAHYASRLGWITREDAQNLQEALQICGFDLNPSELTQRLGDNSLQILQGLEEFREHLGGTLTLSLPSPVGSIQEIHEMNPDWISQDILALQESLCN